MAEMTHFLDKNKFLGIDFDWKQSECKVPMSQTQSIFEVY